jgi:hypothetical protein
VPATARVSETAVQAVTSVTSQQNERRDTPVNQASPEPVVVVKVNDLREVRPTSERG